MNVLVNPLSTDRKTGKNILSAIDDRRKDATHEGKSLATRMCNKHHKNKRSAVLGERPDLAIYYPSIYPYAL